MATVLIDIDAIRAHVSRIHEARAQEPIDHPPGFALQLAVDKYNRLADSVCRVVPALCDELDRLRSVERLRSLEIARKREIGRLQKLGKKHLETFQALSLEVADIKLENTSLRKKLRAGK